MKKVAVIFHSVCGNTCMIAKEYKKVFDNNNIHCDIFRVKDDTMETNARAFNISEEKIKAIKEIAIAQKGSFYESYDALFIGSPTYFGTVSHQTKEFLDSFIDSWLPEKLKNKAFGGFATAGDQYGGVSFTLQTLNLFAQHMGMNIIPVSPSKVFYSQPAYGIIHISGSLANNELKQETKDAIKNYIESFIEEK